MEAEKNTWAVCLRGSRTPRRRNLDVKDSVEFQEVEKDNLQIKENMEE